MPNIIIDQDRCIRCRACIRLCTRQVFAQRGADIAVIAPEQCSRCGHCVAACPSDAIAHELFPLDECPTPAPTPSLDELVNAFRERRSLRVYREQAVPREIIRQLIDIARWVPSASNKQQVDWLAFDDPAQIARLSDQVVDLFARAIGLLRNPLLRPLWRLTLGRTARRLVRSGESMLEQRTQGRDPIFFHAPVVLVAHVRRGSPFGRDDAVYAAYNLILAAQRMGLGACQIGFSKVALDLSPRFRRMLGLPKNRRAQVLLAMGYPQIQYHRALPRRRPELAWNTLRA